MAAAADNAGWSGQVRGVGVDRWAVHMDGVCLPRERGGRRWKTCEKRYPSDALNLLLCLCLARLLRQVRGSSLYNTVVVHNE